jgi:hypothetical protein
MKNIFDLRHHLQDGPQFIDEEAKTKKSKVTATYHTDRTRVAALSTQWTPEAMFLCAELERCPCNTP